MQAYRIKNWATIYENHRTRGLKTLGFVPLPTSLDGDGYTMIMERPEGDGAAIYGAWVGCVILATKCRPRGALARKSGAPHTASSIARMTRMPESIITAMLDFCLKECKWLEMVELGEISAQKEPEPAGPGAVTPESGGVAPPHGAHEPLNRTEQNRTEGKEEGAPRPHRPFFKNTISVRKAKFAESLMDYSHKFQGKMLTAFLNYWGEQSRDHKYMRFEMEKTFEIGPRLDRWLEKERKYGGESTAPKAQNMKFVPEKRGPAATKMEATDALKHLFPKHQKPEIIGRQ